MQHRRGVLGVWARGVIVLAMVAVGGFACAADLAQLDRDYRAASAAGKYDEAEKIARAALNALAGSKDQNKINAWTYSLASAVREQGRLDDALKLFNEVLESDERLFGRDAPVVASDLLTVAELLISRGRYDEALGLLERALPIFERAPGQGPHEAVHALITLAEVQTERHAYAEAEALFARASKALQADTSPHEDDVARIASSRGYLAQDQGKYAEAESLYRRALAVREKLLGMEHHDLGKDLEMISKICKLQARYAEAMNAATRALAIAEKAHGPEHVHVAEALNRLGDSFTTQARFAESEALQKRALAITEKLLPADDHQQAITLRPLAELCQLQGRFAESEALLQRALKIEEKFHGPENADVHGVLMELASLYAGQGKYSDAEPLIQRALASVEHVYSPDHPEVVNILVELADLYASQDRFEEAERLLRRALASAEKREATNRAEAARLRKNLASILVQRRRYDEAEALFQQGQSALEKILSPDDLEMTLDKSIPVRIAFGRHRYDEAETICRDVLGRIEKLMGRDHQSVARWAWNLARIAKEKRRFDEAETQIDRAVTIGDRLGLSARDRYDFYLLRAEIAWEDGRRDEAMSDLRVALKFAEDQHRLVSGGARERATSFASFVTGYERMIQWQCEMGNASEALDAVERSRARSLLEEMTAAGVDLQIGQTVAQRAELARRGAELREQIARLEKLLEVAESAKPRSEAEVSRLRTELAEARERFYQFGRDTESTSEVRRGLLKRESGPPRISQIRRRLCPDGILLAYLFGEEGGYVVVIAQGRAVVKALALGADDARLLQTTPGPLNEERLKAVLLGTDGSGVVAQLANAKSRGLAPKLAALWRILVPENERKALTDGTARHLIVGPDGPLAFLPFEALVVEDDPGPDPKYLLDVGPPVVYGPSSSVLLRLADLVIQRPTQEPVLALGNPVYNGVGAGAGLVVDRGSTLSRSRYRASGGKLNPLPYSGWEAEWVASAFTEAGLGADRLVGPAATEAALRAGSSGRKVLHFACHGLVEQELGNFYGALALTPGPAGDADPSDDGFLTVQEIYALNLKGCELVILSACETNFGPQARGEGTWALSRGFLIAGARRVIASNWVVDDEAAASLMSVNCTLLARAKAKQGGGNDDYAHSLQEAKRWVRKQGKWKAPYFWASLVLVGPP